MTLESITVRFTPTAADYVRVATRIRLHRYGPLSAIIFGVFILYVALNVAALLENPDQVLKFLSSMNRFFFPLFAALIVPLVLLVIGPLRIWLRVSGEPRYLTETSMTFSPDSIVFKDAHNELTQDWSNYYAIMLSDKDIFLFLSINTSLARFIPRRAFESPEQEAALITLLKSKLKVEG